MSSASIEKRKKGILQQFNMDGFLKSVPHDYADYMASLCNTQGGHIVTFLNDSVGTDRYCSFS